MFFQSNMDGIFQFELMRTIHLDPSRSAVYSSAPTQQQQQFWPAAFQLKRENKKKADAKWWRPRLRTEGKKKEGDFLLFRTHSSWIDVSRGTLELTAATYNTTPAAAVFSLWLYANMKENPATIFPGPTRNQKRRPIAYFRNGNGGWSR